MVKGEWDETPKVAVVDGTASFCVAAEMTTLRKAFVSGVSIVGSLRLSLRHRNFFSQLQLKLCRGVETWLERQTGRRWRSGVVRGVYAS